jgi:hypothetical protein
MRSPAKFECGFGDQPRGTVAELTDFAIAYWNGRQVVYTFLREDAPTLIDDEFGLADYLWKEVEWHRPLTNWLASPRFNPRTEVLAWTSNALPFDRTP